MTDLSEWERDLLNGNPKQDLVNAQRNYEVAVADLRDLIQRHLDDHCSKPITFRQELMKQSARVRALEGRVDETRSAVHAMRDSLPRV